MAVINNTLSSVGDSILIKVRVPLLGLTSITGFIDSVVGVTGSRFFTKEFRYALDGINYSNWIALTVSNLNNVSPINNNPFMIEYRYTRDGSDPTGLLEFDFIELQGLYDKMDCGVYYKDSPFNLFFSCNDSKLFGWCLNVLEKVYQLGVIPKYIERSDNALGSDQDYLDFFRSICCFFSYLVNYARVYESFHQNEDLLYEYLIQRGLHLCPTNRNLSELQHLMKNIFDEFRKRGTIQIASEMELPCGDFLKGELLRLLCYSDCDEFLFRLTSQYEIGWTVDNSSPLYQSFKGFNSLTKIWETTTQITNTSNYPFTGTNLNKVTDSTVGSVLSVSANSSIGNPLDLTLYETIDPTIDYEFSFKIKSPKNIESFSLYMWALDKGNNPVTLRSVGLNNATNAFFIKEMLPQANRYYEVIGLLRNNSYIGDSSDLQIGFGRDLKLKPSICKIMPQIVNEGNLDILLYDIKLRPLTNYKSHGFIHSSKLIMSWMKNNNSNLSNNQVERIVRRDLINYNNTINHNWL